MRASVSSAMCANVWRRGERCQYRLRAVVHRLMSVDRERLARRTTELSAIGGSGSAVTRRGLSREEQAARELVGGWLAARGATMRRDAAANLIARFGGDGPAILVGSHLDSVPGGGRFDGALGVLCAVEEIDALLAV